MNMTGVFAGAVITKTLGHWAENGNLSVGFALMGGLLVLALSMQLIVLKPTSDNMQ